MTEGYGYWGAPIPTADMNLKPSGGLNSRKHAEVGPEVCYPPVYGPAEEDHCDSRKRKERKLTNPADVEGVKDLSLEFYRMHYKSIVRDYHAAISRVVVGNDRAAMEAVSHMLAEMKSDYKWLKKSMGELEAKLAEGEKQDLAQEISRLGKAKAEQEAASSAQLERAKHTERSLVAAAKIWTEHYIDEMRQQIEEAAQLKFETDLAQVEAEAHQEAQTCKICLEKTHDVILFPCGHAQYCEDCVEKHRKTQNTCPACRAYIMGTFRYFL